MDSTSSRFGWLPPAVVVTVGAAWLAGRDQDVGAVAGGLVASFAVPALWTAVWFGGRDPRRIAAVAALAVGASGLLGGWLLGAVVGGFVAAGLVGGWAQGRRWPWLSVWCLAALCLVPGFLLELGGTPLPEATAELAAQWRQEFESDLPAGLSDAERTAALVRLDDTLAAVTAMQRRFWPSLVAIGLLAQAAVAVHLGWALARLADRRVARPARGSFVTWRAPFVTVWVLIGSLALGLVGAGAVALVGWNLVLLIALLLAAQGLAVQAWLVRLAVPPLGQTLFWVLGALFFAPVMVGGGTLIGLADQWWDLRRLRRPPA
ncbi:MAG TPA: DUF2232 domain-containing protein [Candidatus Krumholzibacteria bacterium]|nr:DUF2232 domain-containing protein [Candidatus Krumholzibacteria bacterium]HPD72743.1 DUF2232 domain-containing protein [Candidatus Krumholzibacteria bacterium]HRY40325.1 DUF2232 domain-containing protein [Candidatus Krumholzibacteria bacterium]